MGRVEREIGKALPSRSRKPDKKGRCEREKEYADDRAFQKIEGVAFYNLRSDTVMPKLS